MKPLALAAAALAVLVLAGCTYDYLQRTDRVAYSAGDAVRANREMQTLDPSKPSRYSTKGLGQQGQVETVVSPAAPVTP